MTTFLATVTYNTGLSWKRVSSYSATIVEYDAPLTGRLSDTGPVANNLAHRRGVFASLEEAKAAVLAYVEAPAKLVPLQSPSEDGTTMQTYYELRPANHPNRSRRTRGK